MVAGLGPHLSLLTQLKLQNYSSSCEALVLDQLQSWSNPFFLCDHLPTFTPDRHPYHIDFASQIEIANILPDSSHVCMLGV